jgi:hypothetical protein
MEKSKADFLAIATPIIELDYRIVPTGGEDGKSPEILGKNWAEKASNAIEQVRKWAAQFPNANVGIVSGDDQYGIDFDDINWFWDFLEGLPGLGEGTIVVTGSGKGCHIQVRGKKPSWMRNVPNPKYKSKEETPKEKPSLVEFPKQLLGPGSVSWTTGLTYHCLGEFSKPVELPKEWTEKLQSLYSRELPKASLKCRRLKPGTNLAAVLDGTELLGKYEVVETADRIFYNYHERLRRCLVAGHAHSGKERNNAQCAFYVMKDDLSDFGHFCFDTDCQCVDGGQRKAALTALGLTLEDVLRPKWRDAFSDKDELDKSPLECVVERFVQEGGITGIGSISGHGKTYVMLSMAKAVSTGSLLWGFLKTKKYPIIYLIPESGDRALNKRMDELRIARSEDFLVRTQDRTTLALDNPDLMAAARGRVIFLDTLVRWLGGRNENASQEMATLFELASRLLRAGAIAIVLAHHSIKPGPKTPWVMSQECAFRGSGDIVANLSVAHGLYQLDNQSRNKTLIHIECVKPRDIEPLQPFQLEGKPWIDKEGDFRCYKLPGSCGWFKEERKAYADTDSAPPEDQRVAKIKELMGKGLTQDQIAKELNYKDRTAVWRILKKAEKAAAAKAAAEVEDYDGDEDQRSLGQHELSDDAPPF